MLRVREDLLETSVTDFQHKNDQHRIKFCSCIHLGSTNYFSRMQDIINQWNGVIFQEIITGDKSLYDTIPKEKLGLQPHWRIFHELQKMQSQRKLLVYPPDKTISPDISWPEDVRLHDTVSLTMDVSPEKLDRIMIAIKSNPEESYVTLWYILRVTIEEYAKPHEEASYREEWNSVWQSFDYLRKELEKKNLKDSVTITIYDLIVHAYAYEPITSFVPERDTSVLRNIDMERGSSKRNILIVYGAGHYRGVTRGLYERGYEKVTQEWSTVASLPKYSFSQFLDALEKIASTID